MKNELSIEKFLAKSNGETLINHSKKVSETTLKLASEILVEDVFKRYREVLIHASLLHDICKLTDSFIKKLVDVENKSGRNYRHNELGWAFLSKYYTGEHKELLLYLVFWHHGISNVLTNKNENDDEMIKTLNKEEIKRMSDFLVLMVGEEFLLSEDNEFDYNTRLAPSYYQKDNNILFQWKILYGCLVSGDRISSKEIIDINGYFNISKEYNPLVNWDFLGTSRSNEQIEIVENCKGTTMINASAGFGKTVIGLLWGLKRNKKIIWVCPRNTVAEAIFEGISKELKKMNIAPTIQLVLGGEVKKGNGSELFQSDIIITNIDNFLAPSNNNSLLEYYSLINGASVIFDEFHELISESPLFATFINIMQGRNLLTKSETLLLSATPNLINHLWEGNKLNKKETNILPKKGEHYKGQHTVPCKFNTRREDRINNINNEESLVIYNSIKNAQREKHNGNYSGLYHSKFNDEVRNKKLKFLIENFGENGKNKGNIIGTHILQASLDISFKHGYESCLSPDSTGQRFGRVNRFGKIDNPTFTSVLVNNNSEKAMGKLLYNRNLQNIWFEFEEVHNGSMLTINNFYDLYNKFYLINEKIIKEENKRLFNESKISLNRIYPIKYNLKYVNSDVLTAGSNKLRSTGNEVFYIVKNVNGGWSDIYSEEVLGGFDKHFEETDDIRKKMLDVMKELRNNLDKRFDFNDILNGDKYGTGITLDEIRRRAKKSNTPYIRFDEVYDEELGVINNDLFNELKNN